MSDDKENSYNEPVIGFLKKYYVLLSILIFLLGISALLLYISPSRIVEYVGIRNSYAVVFLLAAIGGLSTLTSASFFSAIATFSVGGSEPVLLGLFGGLGIFISDTAFFFLASYGRASVPGSWGKKMRDISEWSQKFPPWVIYVGTFLYIGVSPLPNDVLMIALVAAGFKYRQIAPIILLGSISIATLAAYLARLGVAVF